MAGNGKTAEPQWTAGVRIWIARNNTAILGPGRAELLAEIDRTHSISAAARSLKMSYRRAWELVQAINEAAGESLTEAAVGGKKGGGARLTVRGRFALQIYRRLQTQVKSSAAHCLAELMLPQHESHAIVHLAAATSLQDAVGELLADYAILKPSVQVRTVFGSSGELSDQILAGASVDVFLSADAANLHRLQSAGLVEPKGQRPLVSNGLAAIASVNRNLKINNAKALAGKRVERVVLASPSCPLGDCTKAYLSELGIYDRLLEKAILVDNARAVLTILRAGKADAGIAFTSAATAATDIQVLFHVALAKAHANYWGAQINRSANPDESALLLDFFGTRAAATCFRRYGFVTSMPRKAGKS